MKKDLDYSRRLALKTGIGIVGTALAGRAALAAAACALPTPRQAEGPFYPVDRQLDEDADLTRIPGATARPVGDVVYIRGRVLDASRGCAPVAGAMVEIWQACASGRYNHASDAENPAPLDPNFQYWGQATTDAQGGYSFKTIVPGSYPADVGWMRPPHIHFKVSRRGYHELITQMYFEGERYNDTDHILRGIPRQQRPEVVVRFESAGDGFEPGSRVGQFDIKLVRVV